MKRGDIWWVRLAEPVGSRPVVLVSRPEAYDIRKNVTVIEVTTTVRGLATEVKIPPGLGLLQRCVANADQIHTVNKRLLLKRAGSLDGECMRRVDDALRFSLGLEDD